MHGHQDRRRRLLSSSSSSIRVFETREGPRSILASETIDPRSSTRAFEMIGARSSILASGMTGDRQCTVLSISKASLLPTRCKVAIRSQYHAALSLSLLRPRPTHDMRPRRGPGRAIPRLGILGTCQDVATPQLRATMCVALTDRHLGLGIPAVTQGRCS